MLEGRGRQLGLAGGSADSGVFKLPGPGLLQTV